MKTFKMTLMTMVLTMAVCSFGCNASKDDKDSDEANPPADNQETAVGEISFELTDAPVDGAESVLITINRLEISRSLESVSLSSNEDGDGENTDSSAEVEWISIPLEANTEINLLELQDGATAALAALDSLEIGQYNQIRLFLAEDSEPKVTFEDGTSENLFIPSASKSGIKIVKPFTITAESPLNLVIDFDVRKSLIEKSKAGLTSSDSNSAGAYNYILKPTLRVADKAKSGQIKGTTLQAQTACVYQSGEPKDTDSDCAQSKSSAKVKNGEYTITFLPEGDYEVRLFNEDGSFEDIDETLSVLPNSDTIVE